MAALVDTRAPAPRSLTRIREEVGGGRHRLGRPGLVTVTTLVTVARRGFWASLFRTGRHRRR